MKTSRIARALAAIGYAALGLMALAPDLCLAQTPAEAPAPPAPPAAAPAPAPAPAPAAVSLPPGVDNLIKLTKAGLSEDIILTQVKGIGPVQLTTDQILYLNNAGVSQNVIKALLQNSPAPEPAPSAPPPPEAAPMLPAPSPGPTAVAQPGPPPAVIALPANVRWMDSGIDLAPGQRVSVSANGAISAVIRVVVPYHRERLESIMGLTPDGNPTYRTDDLSRLFVAPGLTAFSLVGRVANSAPFQIGSRATFYSPTGGRLYLSVNANSFERNAGFWNVTISQGGPAAPGMAEGPPPQVNYAYFHDQLAPYGNWVQVPGYDWAWSPSVAVSDPSWRPYANEGHWTYTDAGFYWQSTYPWGGIAFHYGRWIRNSGYGWIWIPAYDWAPGWVVWREADPEGCIGWAPLPPSAQFVAGEGLMFNGQVAGDIDFGLPPEAFVFIGYDHLWDFDYRPFFVPRDRIGFFFGHSIVRNGYRFEGGRFLIDGFGAERLGALTHRQIRVLDSRDLRAREGGGHY